MGMPHGTKNDFPGISSERDPEAIYERYIEVIQPFSNAEKALSRSPFLSIV